jgi:hypothetical protein
MYGINVNVKLNGLQGATVQTATNGKRAIVIPIDQPGIFESTNGNVFLSLKIWEKRGGVDQYGKTHDVQLNYSKEQEAALPQGTRAPYLGTGKEFGEQRVPNHNQYAAPNYGQPAPAPTASYPTPTADLAF